MVGWLSRRRLPKWAVLADHLVGGPWRRSGCFVLFLIYATAQFAKELPTYQEQAQALVQQVQTWLQSMGLDEAGSSAVAGTTDTSGALNLAESFLPVGLPAP